MKKYLVTVEEVTEEAKSFGKQVFVMRKKRGLTGADLAKLVGVSQMWISSIESGKTCSAEVKAKIRQALEMDDSAPDTASERT